MTTTGDLNTLWWSWHRKEIDVDELTSTLDELHRQSRSARSRGDLKALRDAAIAGATPPGLWRELIHGWAFSGSLPTRHSPRSPTPHRSSTRTPASRSETGQGWATPTATDAHSIRTSA